MLCLVCNQITHNARDIAEHYCAHCRQFLEDLPADCVGDLTEGRSPGLLLTGAEPAQDEEPAPQPWERPAMPTVPQRMPWDIPIPPDIAACPLCDRHGFVEAWDATGTLVLLRCHHDSARLRACAARQGYQLVREDHSREPPAPAPQEGGVGG